MCKMHGNIQSDLRSLLVKNNVNPEGAVVTKPTDDKKLHYRSNDEVNNVEVNVSAI